MGKLNKLFTMRARGFVVPPAGFQGVNDAWVCMRCGAHTMKSATLLMTPHNFGRCKGGDVQALVHEKKLGPESDLSPVLRRCEKESTK